MKQKISILLVDDDEHFREILGEELISMGFKVKTLGSSEEAIDIVNNENIDIVILDIKMPGMDGIEALKIIKEISPSIEVIMLTGHGTIDDAISSMKLGAYDYLLKPCKLDELEVVVKRAYEKKVLAYQNSLFKQELTRRDGFHDIKGESQEIKGVIELIRKVADTDATVLIQGESGVGKELVARAIHICSLRRNKPFVVIDCGALTENLLENELLGHEKGAYTGAGSFKYGLFEVADSGTLFMDEIGEISPLIQFKLLRVLETKTFRRVGGIKDIQVDIRLIAATNRDLQKLVIEGKFREDLFYRLNVFSITIPPLRDRREDIPILARHFVEHSRITGGEKKEISEEAVELLVNYSWPGNVRELSNVIERAIILSEDKYILPEYLPSNLKIKPKFLEIPDLTPLLPLKEVEKMHIINTLKRFKGHRGEVAKTLKISQSTLYRRLREYGITKPLFLDLPEGLGHGGQNMRLSDEGQK